jgi:hypothetical protein
MKTLIFWGAGSRAAARARASARFVAWNETHAHELSAAGVSWRAASSYVEPGGAERIEDVAMAWTKAWGRRPLLDGRSFRELARWDGLSLWWWAELYLHHTTEATRYVRLIELLARILEAEAPDEAEIVGLPADEALVVARACAAWRVLLHGQVPRARRRWAWRALAVSWRCRANGLKTGLAMLKASLSGAPPNLSAGRLDDTRRHVLFLSHAAFWRRRRPTPDAPEQSYEHYFDRLIPEVAGHAELRASVVAVGPRAAFRRRGLLARLREWLRLSADSPRYVHMNRYTRPRVWRAQRAATRAARALWRTLRGSPALRESCAHSGVNFSELVAGDLAAVLLLQLPWAVRSYEETRELLRVARPDALCLYAESSGWGRAALAACRAEHVPSVALQHGILYPTYFSYVHDADEQDCPRPERTAVFGQAAWTFLVERGRYSPGALVVTGSPKFDALVSQRETWDRAAVRARLGVAPDERLVVLASRFRPIRSTHQAVGSAFAGLVTAIEGLTGVRLLVKPHPAEPAAAYVAALRGIQATRTHVLSPGADLLELLHACDALVTVESLSAVEALVLERPVLVLNMPTNLRELVQSGAALGVPEGTDPGPGLWAVLFDGPTREALAQARARARVALAGGLDGGATGRIVALLHEQAQRER